MNSSRILPLVLAALITAVPADVVTTAFTWQGRLQQNGSPANGSYDLRFDLYDAENAVSPAAAPVELSGQIVTGGLFTATLDFGAVFNGTAYWLGMSARRTGTATWVPVPGRTAIRTVPYAARALAASAVADNGVATSSIMNGAVTGDKLALSAVGLPQLNAGGTPASGQVLAYDGSGLSWITPPGGGGGSGPWLSNGDEIYYNNGAVGIGTAAPVTRLTVHTPGSNYGLEHTNGTVRLNSYVSAYASFHAGLGTISTHPLQLFAANSTAATMTITPGGLFGFGTTSPASKLTMQTGLDAGGLEHTDGTVRLRSLLRSGPPMRAAIGTVSAHPLELFSGGGAEGYLTLTPDGRMGLGTTSPPTKFTIQTSHNAAGIEHAGGFVRLSTYVGGQSHTAGWLGTLSNHPLSFFTNNSDSRMTIATNGNIGIGTTSPQAKLDIAGQNALRMEGYQPVVTMLDANSGHETVIQSSNGEINFFAGTYTGGSNPAAYVKINNAGNVSMASCTIRGGADLAEPFAMSHEGVEPGAVVVIDPDHPGKLKQSTSAYDKKVAGIVSGANGIRPGISMIQEDMLEAGENVALSGRVYVKAETSAGSIEPGDLLTTSAIPGHAMKAADHSQAQGAILGKAMTGLTEGEGMVLVLVTLQ